MNVDMPCYRPEPLAVTEVEISTPRMRLAKRGGHGVHPAHEVPQPRRRPPRFELLGSFLQWSRKTCSSTRPRCSSRTLRPSARALVAGRRCLDPGVGHRRLVVFLGQRRTARPDFLLSAARFGDHVCRASLSTFEIGGNHERRRSRRARSRRCSAQRRKVPCRDEGSLLPPSLGLAGSQGPQRSCHPSLRTTLGAIGVAKTKQRHEGPG